MKARTCYLISGFMLALTVATVIAPKFNLVMFLQTLLISLFAYFVGLQLERK